MQSEDAVVGNAGEMNPPDSARVDAGSSHAADGSCLGPF